MRRPGGISNLVDDELAGDDKDVRALDLVVLVAQRNPVQIAQIEVVGSTLDLRRSEAGSPSQLIRRVIAGNREMARQLDQELRPRGCVGQCVLNVAVPGVIPVRDTVEQGHRGTGDWRVRVDPDGPGTIQCFIRVESVLGGAILTAERVTRKRNVEGVAPGSVEVRADGGEVGGVADSFVACLPMQIIKFEARWRRSDRLVPGRQEVIRVDAALRGLVGYL